MYEKLSPREKEVFWLISEGLSNKEIAAKLFISPHTTWKHREHIFRELGVNKAFEIIKLAGKIK